MMVMRRKKKRQQRRIVRITVIIKFIQVLCVREEVASMCVTSEAVNRAVCGVWPREKEWKKTKHYSLSFSLCALYVSRPAPEQSSRHSDMDAAGRPQGGVPPHPSAHCDLLPAALWETLRTAADCLPQGTHTHAHTHPETHILSSEIKFYRPAVCVCHAVPTGQWRRSQTSRSAEGQSLVWIGCWRQTLQPIRWRKTVCLCWDGKMHLCSICRI